MSLPKPLPGLVLRYNYLWADEAAEGREEGSKARPAVVVMAVDDTEAACTRVYVLPMTHAPPSQDVAAVEIPAAACRSAGLDAGRSWVILSEFNEFIWSGFDLALVPGRMPRTMAYGFLTPGFFANVRDRWLVLDAAGKSDAVSRDG